MCTAVVKIGSRRELSLSREDGNRMDIDFDLPRLAACCGQEDIGRRVDLLTEAAISPYVRDQVLRELRVLYAA
jgi:hypothetical protein